MAVNTQGVKLDEISGDYGMTFTKFIGSEHVFVNEGKKSGRMQTAFVSLKDKKVITNANEIPAQIRDSLKPVPRRYPYAHASVTCNNLSVSLKDGISMIEGGKAKQDGSFKFWVSLFRHRRAPLVYRKHRWTPKACCYSPEAGICASADKLGEIHVWDSKTGKQKIVFKPVNDKFYHVQWMDDESGIYCGTRPNHGQNYRANHFGKITTAFSFEKWQFVPSEGEDSLYDEHPERRDALTGNTYRLDAIGSRDVGLNTSGGQSIRVFDAARKRYGDKMANSWGNPTTFTFLQLDDQGRLPFIVGTERGAVLQFSVERESGKDRIKLQRSFVSHEAQINSLAVSPSKRLLASSSLDGTVRIWSLSPPRTLADVDFITDGTRIVSVDDGGSSDQAGVWEGDAVREFGDGSYYERIQKIQRGEYQPGDTVRIAVERFEWIDKESVATMKTFKIKLKAAPDIADPLLNFFSAGEDRWIAWTKNGFFNASAKGAGHVGWHVNQGRDKAAKFSRVTQFSKQQYRPDIVNLVAEKWQSAEDLVTPHVAPEEGEPDIAAALAITPDTPEKFEKVRPPSIKIVSPYGFTRTDESKVAVKFTVETPTLLPVTELRIFNNGQRQRVVPEEVDVERRDGIQTTTMVADLELNSGDNVIAIEAEHAETSSNRPEVTVTSNVRQVNQSGRNLYVLAVGISEYANERFKLRYADADARDFIGAWEEQQGKMYDNVKTKLIVNQDATCDGIEDGFDWLKDQKFKSEDVVFVFLAGHASFNSSDTWVFGSTDMNLNKLERTGIADYLLNNLLEKGIEGAGTVVLFLDTCHAGGVKGQTRGEMAAKLRHSQQIDIWMKSQRRVIASCQINESSLEHEDWENGAFTESLLAALKSPESDGDGDKKIDIEELYLRTRAEARKLTDNRQTPTTSGRSSNHGVTPLALTPAP